MNPFQLLKMIKNPKQFAMNIVQKNSNPIFKNLTEMANNGDTKGLQDFARNICKEHNVDFDKEFNEFIKSIRN